MLRALVCILLTIAVLAPASALTEQEIIEQLLADVASAQATAQVEWSVHGARISAYLQLASDKRDLNLRTAHTQLLADIARAGATLTAAETPPAQARGQFSSAIAQALGKYQQAISQVHGQWSQEGSAAWSRLTQDASATLQVAQQDCSSAQQRSQQKLQSPELGEMPPIINGALPDVEVLAPEADPTAALTQAASQARDTYLADIDATFAECRTELEAALGAPEGTDVAVALRKAIARLKLNTLDRHDQYEAEVRAAVRKALLTAME